MGGYFDLGKDHVRKRRFVLMIVGVHIPASIPMGSKILTKLSRTIKLSRQNVVAHTVDLVVRKPKGFVPGVEIHSD